MNQRFGNPASKVCSGSVDLGVILARERPSSVSAPTTIGIDNDLSPGQTSIAFRSANNEKARRLNLDHVSKAKAK